MGCDIHGVLQRRWPDLKGWRTLMEIEGSRVYTLFSILAGVRNYDEIKPISEPRGLPDDFDLDGDAHVYGDRRIWMGDHSHSWFYLEDVENWPGWTDELRARCGVWWAWVKWVRAREGCTAQLRIVFGFDS